MGEQKHEGELTQSPNEANNLSYRQGSTATPLLELTIAEMLEATASAHPDTVAVVFDQQNISLSYREFLNETRRIAAGLLSIGIKKGDRVGIWSPNRVEWCLTQFATAEIGAILVCINPAYRSNELAYALNKVSCTAIVTAASFKNSNYLEMLNELAPELAQCEPGKLRAEQLPHLRSVIRMGDELTPGMFNFNQLAVELSAERERALADIRGNQDHHDPINIQFTSGTTGNPKGATLSHYNVVNNSATVGANMALSSTEKLCIPVPLYHCFGMVMGVMACFAYGATAVFPCEGFEVEATLRVVSEQACTGLHGVPTMFIGELESPNFDQFDLSSLRTGIMAGSPCPVEVMKRVIAKMHMEEVLICYGQTETSPINHSTLDNDPIEKRVGTVGKVVPHVEIKLIDESGAIVPIGTKGELCCRGYSVMSGYWDSPEQTADTIDQDGWLHSGDLGLMDEDGYMQIVGRKKDLVIRGGENIYPREIEECLYQHPQIQDVAVFGIPDDRYGEQVCAWVIPVPGKKPDSEDIKAFCREAMTHFKVPQFIKFVDEFPMTVTGKVQKFVMREAMTDELLSPKK